MTMTTIIRLYRKLLRMFCTHSFQRICGGDSGTARYPHIKRCRKCGAMEWERLRRWEDTTGYEEDAKTNYGYP
jgi:hypothetical protein